MKKHSLIFFLCLLLLQAPLYAQPGAQPPLDLSARQTTSLIFPYPILSVDRGSGDILAQVPEQTANVLQVKGAREHFPNTNLTVITKDGKLYSFPVRYASAPAATLLSLDSLTPTEASVLLPGGRLHDAELDNISRQLAQDARFYHGIKARTGGMRFALEGLYSKGNTLVYRLVLHNASSLPFELEAVRFATKDRRQARRAASQEVELQPYYAWGTQDASIEAGASQVFFFALERFPLGRGKEQVIELYERKGSRHLSLRLRDRHLVRACSLLFE
ncbi:conjugative transposon protein TraN [Pontibacter virosus]|uniref:Conjugative transposon TraN protein n=1 Tax=Pontibacter virosus TaxID=1765052 RepID=A0A2U1AX03_9BACT|nr:conjugative transposon protein TraN [Pontibacter virosus]PVY40922.1 conjugative transposon TraN protein [Pontibacter virosus]